MFCKMHDKTPMTRFFFVMLLAFDLSLKKYLRHSFVPLKCKETRLDVGYGNPSEMYLSSVQT